jgi:hypothetical protein
MIPRSFEGFGDSIWGRTVYRQILAHLLLVWLTDAHKPRRPNVRMMPQLPNAAAFMRWLGRDSGFAIQQPRQ